MSEQAAVAKVIESALVADAWVGHPDPLTAADIRAIAEVATDAVLAVLPQAVRVTARVKSLAANCERKAAEDRAAVRAGDLTLGQIEGLERRAANYDLLVDGLRRVLEHTA